MFTTGESQNKRKEKEKSAEGVPEKKRSKKRMCTAATYQTQDFYIGRTLDYEFSYGEQVTVTPRNYPFAFRHKGNMDSHYAMIGMAHIAGGYPLYYDAVNEKGLGMEGLNFVGNAVLPEGRRSGQ